MCELWNCLGWKGPSNIICSSPHPRRPSPHSVQGKFWSRTRLLRVRTTELGTPKPDTIFMCGLSMLSTGEQSAPPSRCPCSWSPAHVCTPDLPLTIHCLCFKIHFLHRHHVLIPMSWETGTILSFGICKHFQLNATPSLVGLHSKTLILN